MAVYAKNYYSTIEQYSSLASIAFNEAPTEKLSAVGVNSSSIDTSTFDSFRQGVEITLDKYAGIGVFKISAGTPGHIIQPVCLGVNANVDIVDQNFYTELDSLNPVAYLNLSDLSAKNRVYGTEQDFLERRNAYNGIIEPLSIRSVEGFMSNELPFQLHAIRAEFLEGNSGASNFSSEQILTVDYVPKTFISGAYKSKSWFFDGRNASNVDPGTGSLSGSVVITQQSNGCVKYFLTDLTQMNTTLSVVEPFNDSKVYLQSMGLTTATCGSDMMAVFNVMTGSTSNYVPPDKKSATTGFVYDNIGYAGTDSIAFGGMTY